MAKEEIATGSNEGKMPDGPAPWDLPPPETGSSRPKKRGVDLDKLKEKANESLPKMLADAEEGTPPDFGSLLTVLKAGLFDPTIASKGEQLHDTLYKDEIRTDGHTMQNDNN